MHFAEIRHHLVRSRRRIPGPGPDAIDDVNPYTDKTNECGRKQDDACFGRLKKFCHSTTYRRAALSVNLRALLCVTYYAHRLHVSPASRIVAARTYVFPAGRRQNAFSADGRSFQPRRTPDAAPAAAFAEALQPVVHPALLPALAPVCLTLRRATPRLAISGFWGGCLTA